MLRQFPQFTGLFDTVIGKTCQPNVVQIEVSYRQILH